MSILDFPFLTRSEFAAECRLFLETRTQQSKLLGGPGPHWALVDTEPAPFASASPASPATY